MTLAAIAQGVPPLPPPMAAEQPLVLVSRFDELDRQARGAVTHRSIEDLNPSNPRLRRRAMEMASAFERRRPADEPAVREERRPRRGKGEFGLHLAVDAFPERVRHSSSFITQLIAQQFSADEDDTDSGNGVAAYDATAGRADGFYFGTVVPEEAFA